MPVVLRWRRVGAPGPAAARALRSGASRADRASWQLHLHLRVESLAAAKEATRGTPRAHAPMLRPRQVSTEMRHSSGRIDAIAARATRTRGTAWASAPRLDAQIAPAMMSTRTAPKRQLPMATMQPGSRGSVSPSSRVRAASPAGNAGQPMPLRLRLSPVAAPNATRSNAAGHLSIGGALPTRSPDLVWRMREPADANEHTQPQATNAHAARGETAAPEPSTDRTSARTALPALPALAPDPTFVDRVTEGVLRRIDRRLRIERERRGL